MPVVRHTLTRTSFARKLLAYEATWTQKIHRQNFDIHRFRVLTVTMSAARMNSMVEACSQLKRGHGLFLFADKLILLKFENILSQVWNTGKTGKMGDPLN
jgi:hypothetical protein